MQTLNRCTRFFALALFVPALSFAQGAAQSQRAAAANGITLDSTNLSPSNPSSIGFSGGFGGSPPTAPVICTPTTISWFSEGNTCSGLIPSAASGSYSQAINNLGGMSGADTFVCSQGTWSEVGGTASCASNAPPAGTGGTSNSVATENDKQTAIYTVPGNAAQLQITMYNDAPMIWEGEIQNAQGHVGSVAYTRFVQLTNPAGVIVQTVLMSNTVSTMGGHNQGGGCDNNYTDCDRHITSYVDDPSGKDVRGDASFTVTPDGLTNNSGYVYAVTDPNQTASITLYNIPALYKLSMYTAVDWCQDTSQTMPLPSAATPFTGPDCFGTTAAQNGAFNSYGGDTRYIAQFQAANGTRSTWHTDYVISETGGKAVSTGCAAQTFTAPVSGTARTCSQSVPAAAPGAQINQNGGDYIVNVSGKPYNAQCHLNLICRPDYTQSTPTAYWTGNGETYFLTPQNLN